MGTFLPFRVYNTANQLIMYFTIVFQQISSIFCIEMFAKLVYNTK